MIGVEGVGTVGEKEESPIFKQCALSSCTLVPNISIMDSLHNSKDLHCWKNLVDSQ